jgi:hypothetical protein
MSLAVPGLVAGTSAVLIQHTAIKDQGVCPEDRNDGAKQELAL